MTNRLLGIGIAGTVMAALCCFTPLLPWVLGTFGLSHLIVYIWRDDVLLPVMAFFLVLTGYALWTRKRRNWSFDQR